jgi:hypothetical protein
MIGLRVKLSLALKLCKLRGRFLPRVNNVNYTVNYNFFLDSEHVFAIGSRAYFQQPKCNDIEGATTLYTHIRT